MYTYFSCMDPSRLYSYIGTYRYCTYLYHTPHSQNWNRNKCASYHFTNWSNFLLFLGPPVLSAVIGRASSALCIVAGCGMAPLAGVAGHLSYRRKGSTSHKPPIANGPQTFTEDVGSRTMPKKVEPPRMKDGGRRCMHDGARCIRGLLFVIAIDEHAARVLMHSSMLFSEVRAANCHLCKWYK